MTWTKVTFLLPLFNMAQFNIKVHYWILTPLQLQLHWFEFGNGVMKILFKHSYHPLGNINIRTQLSHFIYIIIMLTYHIESYPSPIHWSCITYYIIISWLLLLHTSLFVTTSRFEQISLEDFIRMLQLFLLLFLFLTHLFILILETSHPTNRLQRVCEMEINAHVQYTILSE